MIDNVTRSFVIVSFAPWVTTVCLSPKALSLASFNELQDPHVGSVTVAAQ
ncbi:hypothetical protein NOVOSPHI9U_60099 [Novosphingobium sp. 9U]|nr:hypothetical protein NOVOSPHI9U_60099 [Novosphingobium sp. 9U]